MTGIHRLSGFPSIPDRVLSGTLAGGGTGARETATLARRTFNLTVDNRLSSYHHVLMVPYTDRSEKYDALDDEPLGIPCDPKI